MKIKAFILLLCFSVYFIDTLAAANCPGIKAAKSLCCKMKAKQCTPAKCPQTPKDCSRDCFNCPFFYSCTLPDVISVSTTSLLVEKEFNFLQQRKLSSYHRDVWKPPNGRLF